MDTIRWARSRGMDVRVIQSILKDAAGQVREQGSYRRATDGSPPVITLALSDATSPDIETLRLILHEVTHDFVSTLPGNMRDIVFEAIMRFDDRSLGIDSISDTQGRSDNPQGLTNEVWAEERLVSSLTERGLSRSSARSTIKAWIKRLKDVYLTVILSAQKALGFKPNKELAKAWVENRHDLYFADQRRMYSPEGTLVKSPVPLPSLFPFRSFEDQHKSVTGLDVSYNPFENTGKYADAPWTPDGWKNELEASARAFASNPYRDLAPIDAEYMAALQRNDTETMQRLVDEAAGTGGPNDPITYDDAGNVIPPTQRFNTQSDDIRFSKPSNPGNMHRLQEITKLRRYIAVGREARRIIEQAYNALKPDIDINTWMNGLGLDTQIGNPKSAYEAFNSVFSTSPLTEQEMQEFANTTLASLDQEAQKLAKWKLSGLLANLKGEINRRSMRLGTGSKKAQAKIEKQRKNLLDLMAKKEDLRRAAKLAQDNLKDMLAELRKDILSVSRGAEFAGRISGILEGLGWATDKIESFSRRNAYPTRDAQRFFDAMVALAESGIDIDGPVKSIYESSTTGISQSDPRQLFAEDDNGMAWFAAALGVLREDRALAEILQRRTDRNTESKLAAYEAMDQVVSGTRNSLTQLRQQIRTAAVAKSAADRASAALGSSKAKISSWTKSIEKAEAKSDHISKVNAAFDRVLNQIAIEVGVVDRVDWVAAGDTLFVPKDRDSSLSETLDDGEPNTDEFTVYDPERMKNKDIRRIAMKQEAWLANPANKERGIIYNRVYRQHMLLGEKYINEAMIKPFMRLKAMSVLQGSVVRARQMGLASSQRLAKLITDNENKLTFAMNAASHASGNWVTYMAKVLKLFGPQDHVTETYVRQLMGHIQGVLRNVDGLGGDDRKRTARDIVRRLDQRFDSQEKFDALWNLILDTEKGGKIYVEMMSRWGLKVDDSGSKPLFRDWITRGSMTLPKQKDIAAISYALHVAERAGLKDGAKSIDFNSSFVEGFLRPWIYNPNDFDLPSPVIRSKTTDKDGKETITLNYADQSIIENAFDDNLAEDGSLDFDGFIESVLKAYAGVPDVVNADRYKAGFIERLVGLKKSLGGLMPEIDMSVTPSVGYGIGNDLSIAHGVKGDWVPPEFAPVASLDQQTTVDWSRKAAALAAYGNDFSALHTAHLAVSKEISELAQSYKNQIRDMGYINHSVEAKRALENKIGKMEAEKLYQAYRDASGSELTSIIRGILLGFDPNRQAGLAGELGFIHELISFAKSGVLIGVGSGLTQLQAVNDMMMAWRSPSWGLAKAQVKTYANTLKAGASSFLGAAVGQSDSVRKMIERRDRAGMKPISTATNNWLRSYNSIGGNRILAEPGAKNFAHRNLRRANNLMRNLRLPNLNKDGSNLELSIHPTGAGINIANIGQLMTTTQNFEFIIGEAANYFKAHSEDMTNPEFEFSHDDLVTDKAVFDDIKGMLVNNGMSLEDMARDYVKRLEADPNADAVTPEAYIRLSGDTYRRFSLGESHENLPATAINSIWGKTFFSLISWPWARMNQILNMAIESRKPEARFLSIDLKLAAQALTVLAWTGGSALMWSLLVKDNYDEEVLGKKSNIRPIDPSASIGQNLVAALERASRLGAFGIPGDVINAVMSEGIDKAVDINSRVFVAGLMQNVIAGMQGIIEGGDWVNWPTVQRNFFNALGGYGTLHNIQVASNLLGLDNYESRINARTNAHNYLRGAGRVLNMELKRGFGGSSMTPVTPHVTDMVYAAYGNDTASFREAHQRAVAARMKLRDETKQEAEKAVAQAFSSRHPLRTVFRQMPTEREYKQIIALLNEDGGQAVREAIDIYNRFASMIGGTQTEGKVERMPRQRKTSPNKDILSNPLSSPSFTFDPFSGL